MNLATEIRPGPKARISKRIAILEAAFARFSASGYAQANLDMIAADAGVSKPTIYSYFGDKEALFRETVAALGAECFERSVQIVERIEAGDDLAAMFTAVGSALLELHCEEKSWALRRLLALEAIEFSDLSTLMNQTSSDRVTERIADRLSRLAVAGYLDLTDPLTAAEHFVALIIGRSNGRSGLDGRGQSAEIREKIAAEGVATFLKAYASRDR